MRDYLALIARRKYHILIPFVLIMGVGIALAYLLPPVYKSQATILVQDPEIPDDIIQTTVTGYLQQRIEEIKQRTLTRRGLLELARQIDFYSGHTEAQPLDEDIVRDLREAIIVEMVEVRANDPAARGGSVTVAFTVAFEARDPVVAKRGASAVTNLFIAENEELRRDSVQGVTEFLAERVKNARADIDEVQARLTEFKKQHLNELPEQIESNRMLLEQTEAKVERSELAIREMNDRIATLSGQLSYTDPYRTVQTEAGTNVLSNNERLNVLTSEYKRASATYSPEHPEVRRLRRELQAMVATMGPSTDAGRLLNELIQTRDELNTSRQRYSEEHPDVRRLSSKVAQLEGELSRAAAAGGGSSQPNQAVRPNNPVYVNLQTQLDNARAQLQSEQGRLASLRARVREYEGRVIGSPGIEQEYRSLVTELEQRKATFDDLEEKRVRAELATRLEEGGKSERFEIVESPAMSSKPDRPNRLGIALLSLLLALSAGVGAAAIGEYTDKTIYGSKGLVAAFGAQPIAVIPKIPEREVTSNATARVAQGLATAIVIVLIASAVLFLYQANKPVAPSAPSEAVTQAQ